MYDAALKVSKEPCTCTRAALVGSVMPCDVGLDLDNTPLAIHVAPCSSSITSNIRYQIKPEDYTMQKAGFVQIQSIFYLYF